VCGLLRRPLPLLLLPATIYNIITALLWQDFRVCNQSPSQSRDRIRSNSKFLLRQLAARELIRWNASEGCQLRLKPRLPQSCRDVYYKVTVMSIPWYGFMVA
jgi:hypothetical protein